MKERERDDDTYVVGQSSWRWLAQVDLLVSALPAGDIDFKKTGGEY